ncbi:hypothetical protein DdX_13578 [Ditylenchus destructor]|uniref:Uncharacterized protein n=1 Tax=Ditylenchus destructor TaxID=166010 RepID=A0AAD4MYJ6_9BILA|nr:hypothetical protein DdX_13578 [Ditylenchus destructor]
MIGQVRSRFLTLCLIVIISIPAGSNALYIYLGTINGNNALPSEPKLRQINEHSYSPGTNLNDDYENYIKGNITALKSLVAFELGIDVSNVFRRDATGRFFEIVNDQQLQDSRTYDNQASLIVYACQNNTQNPCF